MCGIAGFIVNEDSKLLKEGVDNLADLTTSLLMESVSRGRSASGIAVLRDDGIVKVYKKAVNSCKLTYRAYYKNFIDRFIDSGTRVVILHARAETKGSANFNENNHPVLFGKWAVVHNGIISNDDALFEERNIKKTAVVDTVAIPMAIHTAIERAPGSAKPAAAFAALGMKRIISEEELEGSYAFAAISPEYKGHLFLAKRFGPIHAATLKGEIFIFASERRIINNAVDQTSIDTFYGDERVPYEEEEVPDKHVYKVDTGARGLHISRISVDKKSINVVS